MRTSKIEAWSLLLPQRLIAHVGSEVDLRVQI